MLFKPFSQTDSSTTREFGGSGLGLSIVSQLAQAMGGDAGVRSEPGQGSTFWFRVPVDKAPDAPIRHAPEPAPLEADATAVLAGHVLVAEDNPVNCMVIEALLGQLGLRVTLVHDGQQAVDAMAQTAPEVSADGQARPDLILMDLNMPVMDGYLATEKIRQWEAANHSPRLPIIALTANAFEEDHQHCLAAGMDDFLTKPIAIEALRLALMRWLPTAPKTPA